MSTATSKPREATVFDSTVVRFSQFLAVAAAFAILPMCVVATTKFATTPFEVFLGLVLSCILSIALIILGLVIPSAVLRHPR